MSLKVLKNTDFTLLDGKYKSIGVQLEGTAAAVQVKTSVAATVTVERAVNAKDFTAVPDFSVDMNGIAEFNIANAVPGQWVRIVSTAAVDSCNILT